MDDGGLVQPPGDRGPASKREILGVAAFALTIFVLCVTIVLIYV